MRPRRFLIVAAVLLVACVAAATLVLPAWVGPRLILTDEGNGYGHGRWHVHRPISIAYFFQNRSGTPLTVNQCHALTRPVAAGEGDGRVDSVYSSSRGNLSHDSGARAVMVTRAGLRGPCRPELPSSPS